MNAAPTDREAIGNELEAFLRESFNISRRDRHFTRYVHLFEAGYVDSPGVVETIAHLERRYGMELPEDVLFDPRFTCINGMAEVIAELLAPATDARCAEHAAPLGEDQDRPLR